MAVKKISELTEITTVDNNDYLPIVDNDEEETKKVTIDKLFDKNVFYLEIGEINETTGEITLS